LVATLGATAFLGCESAASRTCATEYAGSQQKVLKVDPKSADSVRASHQAVLVALAACKAAQRNDEVDHLVTARNQLGAQLEALERRAARKPKKQLGADELAKLEREGDAACPKGQSYRLENGKTVKCTGAQIAEMTRGDLEHYFEERGYRVKERTPNVLQIERGAEQYTFTYPSAQGSDRPSCVVMVPPQGQPWEEAISRNTGVHPQKLDGGTGTVSLLQGTLPYTVDEKNVVVRVGACPAGG
jgi:hypothetical protein